MVENQENNKLEEQERDLELAQDFRRRVVEHYGKKIEELDKGTLAVVLGAAADIDKQVLGLKKLKQDDENALRADKIAMIGLETVKRLNQQGVNPFRRDNTGAAVDASNLPQDIKVLDTVTEEVILTGQEGYKDFEERMSALLKEE